MFTISTLINRAEYTQSILIIAHKYMRMCNHTIVIVIISYNINKLILVSL